MIKVVGFSAAVFALVLTGCSTVKVPQSSGGSKSDATVELSFEHNWIQKPVVDWKAAERTALAKCQAWGYENVEAFSALRSECADRDHRGNCTTKIVTKKYQCIE
ncbi:MAG: YecR family lipoprotein [Gammaproteobacteria bacterium]